MMWSSMARIVMKKWKTIQDAGSWRQWRPPNDIRKRFLKRDLASVCIHHGTWLVRGCKALEMEGYKCIHAFEQQAKALTMVRLVDSFQSRSKCFYGLCSNSIHICGKGRSVGGQIIRITASFLVFHQTRAKYRLFTCKLCLCMRCICAKRWWCQRPQKGEQTSYPWALS